MRIKEVMEYMEQLAPLHYAEDFDNVGLLVGNENTPIRGILVTLDTLEMVVDEAIEKECNLIISFHPIVFSGLKKLNGNTYVERVVMKAIKNDVAIYATHTALDNAHHGVNHEMALRLGLQHCSILIPKKHTIKKLVTYAPINETDQLLEALFEVGAGTIGNYDHCSFSTTGNGTFQPLENATPTLGSTGKKHTEKETQISITFPKHVEKKVITTLIETHSYEEVAYEITTLENSNQHLGIGMIGQLAEELPPLAFLKQLKNVFHTPCIKHSAISDKPIKKVAVLGGSGSFAIAHAKRAGADILVTSDLKYHQFYEAENKILLADIGHYESEQFTKNLIVSYLRKKISNFAIILSARNTNPIKYL